MTDDNPTTPESTPPADPIATPELRKKRRRDQVGMKLHTRPTVSIQQLCAELKMDCTVARKKLRNAGEKPSLYGTWEFERSDLKRVKKLLLA
jgi:hypothetical protein